MHAISKNQICSGLSDSFYYLLSLGGIAGKKFIVHVFVKVGFLPGSFLVPHVAKLAESLSLAELKGSFQAFKVGF